MDIWRLFAAALRRWYVLMPLAVLSLVLAYTAGGRVAPEYTAQSSVLLVPPATPSLGNPYGDIGTATQSISIVLQTNPSRQAVLDAGGSLQYEVAAVARSPILRFVARADKASTAVASANALMDITEAELSTRQQDAGVPQPFQVTMQVLAEPDSAVESLSDRLQMQVVVAGAGLTASFLIAVFVDDIALLWRQRKMRADEVMSTAGSDEEPEAVPAPGARASRSSSPEHRETAGGAGFVGDLAAVGTRRTDPRITAQASRRDGQ